MQQHDELKSPSAPRLSLEEQRAVLLLATRLQQEMEDGASLRDLVSIGKEAGLSEEAIEEAYRQVTAQSDGAVQHVRPAHFYGRELAAVWITLVWVALIWVLTWLDAPNGLVAVLNAVTAFFIVPIVVGALARRVWLAASLGAAIGASLFLATTARFGWLPLQSGAQGLLFLAPLVLAALTSFLLGAAVKAQNGGLSSAPTTQGEASERDR